MSRRTHLIIPLAIPRPPQPAPQPNRADMARARYASVLVDVLNRRISETGELDETLAAKIEAVLWPERV